jgi:hypothetical protein
MSQCIHEPPSVESLGTITLHWAISMHPIISTGVVAPNPTDAAQATWTASLTSDHQFNHDDRPLVKSVQKYAGEDEQARLSYRQIIANANRRYRSLH